MAETEPNDALRLVSNDIVRSPGARAIGFLNPGLLKLYVLITLLP